MLSEGRTTLDSNFYTLYPGIYIMENGHLRDCEALNPKCNLGRGVP